MNFAQAFAMQAPTVGGLPLETFIDLQQMLIDGQLAVLISTALEYQTLQESAEDIVELALRKARHSK